MTLVLTGPINQGRSVPFVLMAVRPALTLTLASLACLLTSSDPLKLSASTPALTEPTKHGPTVRSVLRDA